MNTLLPEPGVKFAFIGLVLFLKLPSSAQALPNIVIDYPTQGTWEAPAGVSGS